MQPSSQLKQGAQYDKFAEKSVSIFFIINMNTDGSVNPVQSNAELYVESETVQSREPPPPYSPPESAPVTVQPVFNQRILLQPALKDGPTLCHCPRCGKSGLSTVQYVNSRKTHLVAGFICGFTCWCLICCLGAIPYCIKTFKKTEHYCSTCEYYIGSYSRI